MDRAWRKLLRITKEGSQTQEIFPLHLIQKSLAAGFLEISQGYAISHSCLSFPVELNLFEKVVYGRTDSQTRVVFDGIGNDETGGEHIQLSLLSHLTVVRSGRITSNRNACALAVFRPVEIVGSFRMFFWEFIHYHPVGLHTAVGTDDNRTVALALRGVDTFGDIHLHGTFPRQSSYHPSYTR